MVTRARSLTRTGTYKPRPADPGRRRPVRRGRLRLGHEHRHRHIVGRRDPVHPVPGGSAFSVDVGRLDRRLHVGLPRAARRPLGSGYPDSRWPGQRLPRAPAGAMAPSWLVTEAATDMARDGGTAGSYLGRRRLLVGRLTARPCSRTEVPAPPARGSSCLLTRRACRLRRPGSEQSTRSVWVRRAKATPPLRNLDATDARSARPFNGARSTLNPCRRL